MIEGVKVEKNGKWLGIDVQNNLGLDNHLGKTQRKMSFVTFCLKPLLSHCSGQSKIRLFKTFIEPYFYGLSPFKYGLTDTEIEKVERIRRKWARKFLGLSFTVETTLVNLMVGTWKDKSRILEKKLIEKANRRFGGGY